jgi:predicted DNA-binding transcriptional regulator AlpA
MLSIIGFCKMTGISRSSYYNLKAKGEGPRETHIGSRRLISETIAAEWLKSQEVPAHAKAV